MEKNLKIGRFYIHLNHFKCTCLSVQLKFWQFYTLLIGEFWRFFYFLDTSSLWDLCFPGCSDGKESACNPGSLGSRRRRWQPTPVFLLGEFHGQRSPADYLGSQRVGHNWATNIHTPCRYMFYKYFLIFS